MVRLGVWSPAEFSGENLMKLSTPVSGSGCWWVAVGWL